ncbi:NAD(P)/FAD-dependent oxidoreductase [Nonomuraea muscovyensis]|uniref:NADH dehydrogenase n=1 Tax=Nonomuraea muscovyensis TaxID=1124761 RepID=A0A7X0C5P8_9ACTN|nr:NAD(P)/FAD-dependent oxidoreductase [Nonomuraea muscovyensis]MBB6349002.1 NADH dehydrogenase [Nonomuraea muscovyensis]
MKRLRTRPGRPAERPARPRVVVVGAGFAGLNAARELARGGALVALVDHHPYTTFQPLLYQVATAGLSAADTSYPLRAFAGKYPNLRVRVAGLGKLHLDDKRVELDDGTAIDYDYLVLASGVTTNWLGIKGAEEHAMPLYGVRDAVTLRRRLQRCLEEIAEGKRPTGHVVVVGGGATGVEIAGTMAELRRRTLPLTHPEIKPDQTSVTLVERFDYVLAPYKPRLRDAAAHALRERGVRLRLGSTVAAVEPEAVVLADGTRLHSDATVWALGVTAPDEVAECGLPQGKGGRVVVTEALNLEERPEVFVAGDLALPPDPLPQLAQPAVQMGKHVGRQILAAAQGRPLKPFSYRDPGIMAIVGRAEAVVQLRNGRTMRGLIAWLVWIFVHVAYLLGGRNRITVLVDFFWRYLGPRRSAASVAE